MARQLREEQDREFQETLERDRRFEEEQRLAAAAAAEEERNQTLRREAELQEKERRRSEARSVLAVEPEPGDDVATIAVRTPGNSRLTRRFHNSDTLQVREGAAWCLCAHPRGSRCTCGCWLRAICPFTSSGSAPRSPAWCWWTKA